MVPGLILGLRPANERRRYKVTPSLTGWAQTLNQPWVPLVKLFGKCPPQVTTLKIDRFRKRAAPESYTLFVESIQNHIHFPLLLIIRRNEEPGHHKDDILFDDTLGALSLCKDGHVNDKESVATLLSQPFSKTVGFMAITYYVFLLSQCDPCDTIAIV